MRFIACQRPHLGLVGHEPCCICLFASARRRNLIVCRRHDASCRRLASGSSDGRSHLGPSHAPLALLPLRGVLRSLVTSTVSSSSLLLPMSLRALSLVAKSQTPLLDPDRNPVLRYLLDKSLYKQFCAGKETLEVSRTVAQVKRIGFTGAILACAKESPIRDDAQQAGSFQAADDSVSAWADSSLATVRMAEPGDFVALKFSGAGQTARSLLSRRSPPNVILSQSLSRICEVAASRGVRILIDGEHDELQPGIDEWTMLYSRKYNPASRPIVFGTYQAYKKCTPGVLSRHLADAQRNGFALGIKLVRGAYLASDPRDVFHGSKQDTDACFDRIAGGVLQNEWNAAVQGKGNFPRVVIMLATHNATSVRKAYAICCAGRARSDVLFGQLQGMADEISCELVEINKSAQYRDGTPTELLPVYKYMAWGSTGECIKYLLRRAEENKEAVTRTREDRNAMRAELVRRMRVAVGYG